MLPLKTLLILLSGATAAKYPFCTLLSHGDSMHLTEDVRAPASIDWSGVITDGREEIAIFRNNKRSNGHRIIDDIAKESYCSQKVRKIIQDEGDGDLFSLSKGPPKTLYEVTQSGLYAVSIANCNYRGTVRVCGRISFQSKHGYLPTWMYDLMWTTYVTAGLYVVVVAVSVQRYYLQKNKGKKPPTDIITLIVLLLGLAEVLLVLTHYMTYNRNGSQQDPIEPLADLLGSIKTGAGRALLLLAAFGGGLVRDLIVPVNFIICLCTFYATLLVLHVALRYSVPHHDFSLIFDILCGVLDLYFILWSILAVNRVIRSLETSDATKARRFMNLRRLIILLPFIGLVPWKRFLVIDDDRSKAEFIISGIQRVTFLLMVVCLQCLLASIPTRHRSRVRVELPSILPAFSSKAAMKSRHEKIRRSSLTNDLDSYGVDDETSIPVEATDDDEENSEDFPLNTGEIT